MLKHIPSKKNCSYFQVENLKASRPTKFVAVPRVWEKMQEKMEEAAAKNGSFKRALVTKSLLA